MEKTNHIIHTNAGAEVFYGTAEQVCLLQDAREARRATYDIACQLELIYKDIQAGAFGEAAKSGEFYRYIQAIKQAIPKPGDSV